MTPDPQDIIHQLALAKGLTTATAESLTAGMVSSALASRSGASGYHLGGVTAYNIDAKVNILGVDRALAQACNCVSLPVVLQMAYGARKLFGADCVLATTGYAEPWPKGNIPESFAYYAVLCGDRREIGRVELKGFERTWARLTVTRRVLEVLAQMLGAL